MKITVKEWHAWADLGTVIVESNLRARLYRYLGHNNLTVEVYAVAGGNLQVFVSVPAGRGTFQVFDPNAAPILSAMFDNTVEPHHYIVGFDVYLGSGAAISNAPSAQLEYGATCNRCESYCPDALRADNFRCYSCRSVYA